MQTDAARNSTRARAALIAMALCAVVALPGCVIFHHTPSGAAAQPLSDDQSRAQVIGPAQEAVKAAHVNITYATFEWESCNDQGDPPYQGRVDVAVVVPPGTDSQTVGKQITAAVATQPGWAPGPPPGLRPFGELAHKGNVMLIAGVGNYPDRASIQVVGECRNTNQHHDHTGPFEVTDQVRG